MGEVGTEGLLVTTEKTKSKEEESTSSAALHIEFEVAKSDTSGKTNKFKITVYNLSDTSITKISKDFKVIFEAGYTEDALRTLFIGQVENVETEYLAEVVKTTITCVDGYKPKREGYTSTAFRGGTTVETILRQLITKDLGLSNPVMNNGKLGADKGLNKIYENGSAKVGNTYEIITKLCRDNFLTWSVRDGNAIVYPVDGSTEVKVPLISAGTGMIGSPQKSLNNTNKLAKSKNTTTTYKVKTLLNGSYNIGNLVEVVSAFTSGLYRISKVTHKGSFDGNDWTSDLEISEGITQGVAPT